MKRNKLTLNRETLRALAAVELRALRGGVDNSNDWFPCVTERITNCVAMCESHQPDYCAPGSGAC